MVEGKILYLLPVLFEHNLVMLAKPYNITEKKYI